MVTYEEALKSKETLYSKIKELSEQISDCKDSSKRYELEHRRKVLRDMYRDACYQLEYLRPVNEKKYKQNTTVMSAQSVTWDFFERSQTTWADIEGVTWTGLTNLDIPDDCNDKTFLTKALHSAMNGLTNAQRECILLYESGLSQDEIAQKRGTHRSTVSRNIRNGMRNLERYIIASLQARTCATEDGFDFLRFAETTEILTERMREYLYLLLTKNIYKIEIAKYLGVGRGSLYVSEKRIENNLSNVEPGIEPPSNGSNIIEKSDWINLPEKEIAERLALTPAAYYKWVCRNELVGGIPRIAYEVLRLNHLTAKEAGKEIGLSAETISRYRKLYAHIDISKIPEPERYYPRKKEKVDIRRLLVEAR